MALIDDLEKEGYDVSQITPELISSLEKEGYDVSGLQRPAAQTPKPQGKLRKAYETAKIPMQKSREGLKMIEDMTKVEPTGNVVRDVALNIPSVAAGSLAEVAPSFVSPESVATGGIGRLAKAAIGTAKGAAAALRAEQSALKATKGMEQLSGAQPGTMVEAVKDPLLAFRKGADAAGEFYEAGKSGHQALNLGNKAPTLDRIYQVGKKALETGELNPRQALQLRKALRAMQKGKGYDKDIIAQEIKKVQEILKNSKSMSEADQVFIKGLKAESARTLFPQTTTGKPGVVRTAIMGKFPPAATIFSPAAQAAMGAGVGMVARAASVPFQQGATPAMQALYRAYERRKKR